MKNILTFRAPVKASKFLAGSSAKIDAIYSSSHRLMSRETPYRLKVITFKIILFVIGMC